MSFFWTLTLAAISGLVGISLLVVWGVRVLARKDRAEERASRISVDVAAALAREPRLRQAAILPVASIPLQRTPRVELTGRVPSTSVRDVAVQVASRATERLCPGMQVVDHLEIAPTAEQRPA